MTTEPADVRAGSGTAVAVRGLAAALGTQGVHLAVRRTRVGRLGHTLTRARERRRPGSLAPLHDVILGVNGDGLEAARRAGLPFVALPKALYGAVVAHEHGLTRRLLARHARWELDACRAADAVVAPSRAAAALLTAAGVHPFRIHVIGEPLDGAAWRASLPMVERLPGSVLLVAHLYPRKRVRDLLDAWPSIRTAAPGATLHVAGDGPELHALRRIAAHLEAVTLHGHVEGARLRALYARASVAVSTSAHETFGYAALEALATGLPLVAADAPAVAELADRAVGRICAVGDVDGLVRGVVACLSPGVAGAAERENPRIADGFAPDRIGAAYVSLLRQVLARQRPQAR